MKQLLIFLTVTFRIKIQEKIIGHAKVSLRLYYLDSLERTLLTATIDLIYKSWLHHKRLRHPSVSISKVIFPLLFTNSEYKNIYCDICEFVKHKHIMFPISDKRISILFSLIHSDIQEPFHKPNIYGALWFMSRIDDCITIT